MPDEIFWRQNLDHHRQLFIPSRRRFVFFLRLRIVLRRLRDGGAWQDDEWRRLMNGRPMGERFFLDRKISQSEARNFLPVKYANFVRCAFCVFRSHSFVSLARFALPYPRIFLAVVHGIDESIRLSGSAVWLSTSAYSHFAAVCSQRTAGAVRLVRGRDALTISDIGTISFVTCFSDEPHEQRAVHCFFAERSAFTLSHTLLFMLMTKQKLKFF